MKSAYPKALLLLVLCLITAVNVLASNEKQQQVAAIKELAANIDAQSLSLSTVSVGDDSGEHGSMDVYRDANGKVRKLVATLSGGPTRIVSEYYLENEQPRLAYETRVTPGALTMESRYFFAEGRLIQWLEAVEGQPASTGSTADDYGLQEYHVLDSFQTLRKSWSR